MAEDAEHEVILRDFDLACNSRLVLFDRETRKNTVEATAAALAMITLAGKVNTDDSYGSYEVLSEDDLIARSPLGRSRNG